MKAYVTYRHRGVVHEATVRVIQTASAVRQLFHKKPELREGGFTLLHVRGTCAPKNYIPENHQNGKKINN